MGTNQVKRFMEKLGHILHIFSFPDNSHFVAKIEKEFDFLMEHYGYAINHCAYLNAMYWVVDFWSVTEKLGFTISNEMGIDVFVWVPADCPGGRVNLYLPALLSYLTKDNTFIEMRDRIPLVNGVTHWYASLLKEHYQLISLAMHSTADKARVIGEVQKYIREYEQGKYGGVGLQNFGPIRFRIDDRWEFRKPCWVKKQESDRTDSSRK